jgi:hypothetical protein
LTESPDKSGLTRLRGFAEENADFGPVARGQVSDLAG